MAVDADAVAAALAATWQHLAGGLPGAWTLRDGGALAWVSGVALPTLNGVWAERADMVRLPGVRCYLGEMGGGAVTTGLGVTLGEFVGVFNIATRRRTGGEVTALR